MCNLWIFNPYNGNGIKSARFFINAVLHHIKLRNGINFLLFPFINSFKWMTKCLAKPCFYLNKNNVFFIAVSILACIPIIPTISSLLEKTEITRKAKAAMGIFIPAALLILSAFALAGDSYNPFLYFQF